jgi:hypothetical protein
MLRPFLDLSTHTPKDKAFAKETLSHLGHFLLCCATAAESVSLIRVDAS